MGRHQKFFFWALACLLLVSWSAAVVAQPAASSTPKELTANLVRSMEAAPDKSLEERQALAREVRGYFDFDNLVRAAIEPQRSAFTPQQMNRYESVFGELLDTVPFLQPSLKQRTEFTLGSSTATKSGVVVNVVAYVPEDDLETNIAFKWQQINGQWRVVDVSLDGASLLLDYRNQFSRIVTKEGPTGLLSRLESKLENLRESAKQKG